MERGRKAFQTEIIFKATLHKESLKGKGYIIFIGVKSNTREVSVKVYEREKGN